MREASGEQHGECEEKMSDPIRIEFVALGSLSAQTPFQPSGKRTKNKVPLTLVLLVGQDLALGEATRKLVGPEGEAFLKKAATAGKFKGKKSSVLDIIAPSGFSADRLLLVGTGVVKESKPEPDKEKDPDTLASVSEYTNLGGSILGRLGKGANVLVAFDPPAPPEDPAGAAADLMLGMRLRDYRFDLYKTKKKDDSEESSTSDIFIAVDEPSAARREAKIREAVSEGVMTARSLVNEPANILYPEEFAKRAQTLEKLGVEITILDEPAMEKLGMGALLGVGQGSARESRVVIMRWRGMGAKAAKDSKAKPIAFVGKGVCFDTGGISIKGASGMEDMKGDMAGAACVVGLIQALAARKAKVDVIGAIGLTENMPGAEAQRPGDIVKSMSGQTIEVINTDAEGRLVLADVLWYVQDKYKPKFIVDLATLTGAILVALGQEYAGLFSNDDDLSEKLMHVGKETGEKLWRMPLGAAYDKLIDSKFADMKNTGGRHGGSITAAQFLQRFVNDTPWAHLDIAGTGMSSPSSDINQSWGSGWGVRLLDRFVSEYYED
jgi:leucyl aminopeptidase